MSYLRDEPGFECRVLLRGPREAEVLVTVANGRWRLPRFVSREQHTSEVAFVNRAVRERLGVDATVLRCLWTDFDASRNVVRKLYALETHGPTWTPESVGGAWVAAGALIRASAEDRDVAAPLESWARQTAQGPVVPDGQEWIVPGWWDRALAWARRQLHPVRVQAVEQLRSSESSSVIRLDTEDGAAFLKAVAASLAREVPITAALSRVSGSVVPEVVAVDLTQRWMLLRGAPGRPLEELRDVAVWEQAVGQYARFQLAAAAQVGTLTALGCPTLTRADLEHDILEVLASDQAMQAGEPGGLEGVQVRRLRALQPELLASATSLERTGQVSIDHGDLFPGNVLSTGRTSQIVDWEDARIAHPFLSVFPLLAGARMQGTFDDHRAASERIRDAYLRAFAGLASVAALRATFDAAQALAAVRMAATYLRTPGDIQRAHPWMREMPAFCLRTLLESRDAVGG